MINQELAACVKTCLDILRSSKNKVLNILDITTDCFSNKEYYVISLFENKEDDKMYVRLMLEYDHANLVYDCDKITLCKQILEKIAEAYKNAEYEYISLKELEKQQSNVFYNNANNNTSASILTNDGTWRQVWQQPCMTMTQADYNSLYGANATINNTSYSITYNNENGRFDIFEEIDED